ncbi:hypothetical protein [Gorillibacterium sp. sgz5001074]|uniref:hypothetical protein n=1 Tax=Gorillibacterium sp. sgz5001074 TaxID=3446695 RepID=UPI003F67F8A4
MNTRTLFVIGATYTGIRVNVMKIRLIYVLIILVNLLGCDATTKLVPSKEHEILTTSTTQSIDKPSKQTNITTEKIIEQPNDINKEVMTLPKRLTPKEFSVSFSVYKNFDRELTKKEVNDFVINDCSCEGDLFKVNFEGKDEEGIFIFSIRRRSDTVAKGWYYIDPRTGNGIKDPG